MESYEQKYRDALERAKKLYEKGTITESLNYVFPELKESEDEKIRKHLISLVKNWDKDGIFSKYTSNPKEIKQILAWLEKQGEQKSVDKLEPKFKVGYWIASNINSAKIIGIEGDRCEIEFLDGSKSFPHIDYVNRIFHLWTIEDAKDGDVLALISGQNIFIFDGHDREYCHYSKLTDSFIPYPNYIGFIQHQFVPATKEQRDTLFAKMREAGYEWDAEEKELKKMETKGGEE